MSPPPPPSSSSASDESHGLKAHTQQGKLPEEDPLHFFAPALLSRTLGICIGRRFDERKRAMCACCLTVCLPVSRLSRRVAHRE